MPRNSPSKNRLIIARGNSRKTYYYISLQDEDCLNNTKLNSTMKITLLNAQAISPTTKGNLSLYQSISRQGKNAVILP